MVLYLFPISGLHFFCFFFADPSIQENIPYLDVVNHRQVCGRLWVFGNALNPLIDSGNGVVVEFFAEDVL